MDNLLTIADKLIWPVTLILIILILKKAISDLIPKLKKLKYKDFEMEFEREASQIRAEIERDIPEIQKEEEPAEKEEKPKILFSLATVPPEQRIINSWKQIEEETFSLMKRKDIPIGKNETIRAAATKLLSNNILNQESVDALLDLAAFRNKVSHAKPEYISVEVAQVTEEAANRLQDYFRIL